jgi:ABC-type uncharacterized transport system substrate-binding protein
MRKALISSFTALLLAPGAAGAHPHIFIDTGLALVVEDGMVTAVRVDWAYDEFYTMLLVEDKRLDADGDGLPEQDRLDAFAGRDVDWEAGFPGHVVLTRDGREVALAGPEHHAARFEDNRLITSHVRPLAHPFPVAGPEVVARAYDPGYFVAYDVPQAPVVLGREGCEFERQRADREAAQEEYGERLAEIDQTGDPFEVVEVADIGILFADSFTLNCAPRAD